MNEKRSFSLILALTLFLSSWSPWLSAAPVPHPDSGEVAFLVGKILANEHYRQQPLDDSVSREFLKLFLNDVDYNHIMFLQSDIDEFQKLATKLDDEIQGRNVKPAYDIFARYAQRVEQRVAWAKEFLKEKHTFDGNDEFLLDRRDAPWPATEEESRQLWRQRVRFDILQERLNKKKAEEISDIVGKRYDRLLKTVQEEDANFVLELYLSALAHAYDPHSEYFPPTELDNFAITMKLSLVGIGALLTSEEGYPKVTSIVAGGPADLDKRLKINDRIAAVAQGDGTFVDVLDMKLNKAVELIRGEKGSEVRLLVIPADATDPSVRKEIRLKRGEIKLTEAEAKGKLIQKEDAQHKTQRLGYIELPSFYADMSSGPDSKSTTRDVARIIEKLKSEKIDGLILDLRRNGGGSLPEAINLTGLFIKSGPILQVKNARGHVKVLNDEDPGIVYDGPLIVLVSHISASASEILAAALQDYGRAVIVGDQGTFGKGTVQKVEELNRYLGEDRKAGALKLTTQKFYRVRGGSTQYKGVIPDVQWPSDLDYLKINEATLKNPLPYDEVSAATFTPFNRVATLVPDLKKRSQERIQKDPEFVYIREDIERLKTQLEDKTASLNEAKRLEEKKTNLDRISKRKKEREGKTANNWKVTEITLDSLDANGTKTPSLTRKDLENARARTGELIEDADSDLKAQENEAFYILSDLVDLTRAAKNSIATVNDKTNSGPEKSEN
jgi:carboxyl-terminal processing protease